MEYGLLTKPPRENGRSLADVTADRIREKVMKGVFIPGQHLSEAELGEVFQVSRNTLREGFRVLTKEGLLRHEPNRGVFVAVPNMATIVDLYRVRRIVECPAMGRASSGHSAIKKMREAVEQAKRAREVVDWLTVGSADISFHTAIVALADSPRLDAFFSHILAEMRLAFGLISDPELLYSPFIELNEELVSLLEKGKRGDAAAYLDGYLGESERIVLGAFLRN